MNKEEVISLLEYIETSYPNFTVKDKMVDAWLNELCMYDTEDVTRKLKELMAEDYYQKTPPLVSRITWSLTKKNDKLDYSKTIYYCDICHKAYNSKEEVDKHFDRCSSIRYMVRQAKKWANKDLDKKALYQMSDEEFDKKYKNILDYICKNTKDESEKTLIGFIFNPPKRERAKEFIENEGKLYG